MLRNGIILALLYVIVYLRIGRKKALYVTFVILLASAFGVCWAPEFISFVILQFIIGAANHGAFMICCVLGQCPSVTLPVTCW